MTVCATDGAVRRVDANGRPAAIANDGLIQSARLLAQGRPIASQGLLSTGDTYYYSAPGSERVFPVYRVNLADAEHTRYYIDAQTGALLGRIDSDRRGYRWLFDGLHRVDFFAWLRVRPLWDFVVVLLLLGGIAITGSGCYLGVMRVKRDVTSVTRHFRTWRSSIWRRTTAP